MKNLKSKALQVIVVIDGRPGHEKQSFGIVQGLSNRVNVEQYIIDVSKRTFSQQVRSYLGLLLKPMGPTLSLPKAADFVIGTGTRTHSTVLAIKKRLSLPAVTCMSPGKHLRDRFDICFVPEHDGCKPRNNIFITAGAPNTLEDRGLHEPNTGLILLGGIDNKSHIWNQCDIEYKIRVILNRERDIQWSISSSPRTPEDTVHSIKKTVETIDNAQFYDYKNTHKGWVEERYDASSTVWVTTDSISMLYEAITAGCRVNVIPVEWFEGESKFKRNEDLLIEKGLVTPFSAWDKGDLRQSEKPQLNEAQRCADHIIKTWWPENIQ